MKKAAYLALIALFILTLFISGCVDQKTTDHQEKNITPWNSLKDSPLKLLGLNDRFGFHHDNNNFPPKNETDPLRKNPEIFIEDMITRSEITALQVEEEINRLEASDKDVGKLKDLLENYDQAIKRAREKQRLAYETEPVTQVNKRYYLTQSLQELNEANGILKEIFEELKLISPGSVELNLTDSISANGNGTAILSGNLIIGVHIEDGMIAISDYKNDMKVVVDGDHESSTVLREGHNVFLYKEFNGYADISGSNLAVMIKGSNISFNASGQGEVIMSGNGTYTISKMDDQTKQEQWMTSLPRP